MDLAEFDDNSIKKIQKIQSFFRQNYVKNEMKKIQLTYEEIFNEIEGDDSDVTIKWPESDLICLPQFIDKKHLQVKTLTKPDKQISKIQNEKNAELERMFDVDLNIEQVNYLSTENLKNLSKTELLSVRENVSLEMLWIQQAIQSRLQYLQLKRSFKNQKKQQSGS